MAKKITIIGAGPGGYVAAIRAAQSGAEVTVIEQDNVGGTCLNRGCIPSKIMKTTAEMLDNFKRSGEFGVIANERACLDMERLMTRKQEVIQSQSKGILGLFKKNKIQHLKGHGQIKGPSLAVVRDEHGKTQDIQWDSLILALGSQPLTIPSLPFDGKKILSSNDALNLREIPESMLIVGGGVIGCEFAFIFASFGSEVTVVEALPRMLPLPSVDEDCSKTIQREMKKRGIKFMVDRSVESVKEKGEKICATIGDSPFSQKKKDLPPVEIEVEKVLVCIGRKPDTADAGLENLGVRTDDRGWIIADERMETSVPGVYAIGDVLGPSKIMLAHVASNEGIVAAENAAGGNRVMNYNAVPGAVFTMPEVSNVGLTEAQARDQGYNVRADTAFFRALGKAHVIGEIAGQAKIVSDAENGKVLGVHIVGPHAADLIAEGTLAVQMGCTVKDLAETIHAHPTLPEIIMEVSFKSTGKGLHG